MLACKITSKHNIQPNTIVTIVWISFKGMFRKLINYVEVHAPAIFHSHICAQF